jgi:6-phosphogluconate dehydrogenase
MQLAMIGLGRMGGNMTERLMRNGHRVVVFDRSPEVVQKYVGMGAVGAAAPADVVANLAGPRVVWIMVPAGKPVDDTIAALLPGLSGGDVIIDGGNSNFHDSMRRAAELKDRKIHFVDSGTSGGIWGLENGYCLMVGASPEAFTLCEPIFKSLAPPDGYAHMGPPGSGHYVKMFQNGIEYGSLQAYAEG